MIPSIFFYPDRPQPFMMIGVIAKIAGWRRVEDPALADWCVLYRNATSFDLPLDDPFAEASRSWINGQCRDVSKRRVHALFAQTFGYSLAVDPATHSGPMVLKSDANYVKDARIATGPVTNLPPELIAERLVDASIDGGEIEEYRVGVVGRRVIYTHLQYRPNWIPTGALINDYTRFQVVVPGSILSAEEIARIEAFSEAYALDFGAIDVLRDRHDGRIFIIDANNTPGAPHASYPWLRQEMFAAHFDAWMRTWPPRGDAAPSSGAGEPAE